MLLVKHRLVWCALTAASLVTACTGGQFGSVGGAGKTPEKKDKEETANELGKPTDTDPEDSESDDPVMVSGAFLTCTDDVTLPSGEDYAGVGCVVMQDDEKVELEGYDKVEWTVLTVFNIEVPATFTKAASTAAYNVTTEIPMVALSTAKVRLKVEKQGKSAELYSYVGKDGGGTGGANGTELGQTEDFQLGDDSYDPDLNKGCNARLGAVKLRGHGLRVPFQVKGGEATVAVTLKDICGVTYDTNAVVIADSMGLKRYVEGFIAPKAVKFELKGLELPEGDYHLDIMSLFAEVDRDDYIVGGIVFTNTGEVVIGKPTAFSDF